MGSSDGGISNDDTLADDPAPARPSSRRLSLATYDVAKTIGEGGMGEVLLAHDRKIGRDVAIKRMRTATPTPELVDRFLREAKIQARLDHPAIVPVYELGHDADGAPYFAMKRVAGTTLLERLQRGDASLQALLRAFVQVCQAIEFAHTRGVVHRDLKPANIVLGEFGEVYVLDWGVARVLEREDTMTPAVGSASVAPGLGQTQVGAVLGTPGYMAPEQARGDQVGLPADVFSLGKILLEILGVEAQRGGAIPPELDALRAEAVSDDPDGRPTAHELGARVQSYLDGDRDQEHRSALAEKLVARARERAHDPALRANAIRDAGRALALDPESVDAASLVMSLMLEPPKVLPAGLVRRLAEVDAEASSHAARHASMTLAAGFLAIPPLLAAGVTSWPLFIAIFVLVAGLSIHAYVSHRTRTPHMTLPLIGGAILLVLLSRILGPLVVSPTLIGLFVIGLGSQPSMLSRSRDVLGFGIVAYAAPFVLEATGVFARTWDIAGGQLVVRSQLFELSGAGAYTFLIGANAVMIGSMFVFMRQITAGRRAERLQIEVHAWQLQQLLPAPPPSPALEAAIAADLG